VSPHALACTELPVIDLAAAVTTRRSSWTLIASPRRISGLSPAFTWVARKTTPPSGGSAPTVTSADDLGPDRRTVFLRRLNELAEAWRDPAAWTGMT